MDLTIGDSISIEDKDGNTINELPCMNCGVKVIFAIGSTVTVILDENNFIMGTVCDLCETVHERKN